MRRLMLIASTPFNGNVRIKVSHAVLPSTKKTFMSVSGGEYFIEFIYFHQIQPLI